MLNPIVVSGSAAIALCVVGGLMTPIGPWYRTLRKPRLQPPNWLFGPAWTIILGLAAWSASIAWTAAPDAATRAEVVTLFAVNAVFHLLWSPLFFRARRPDWALIEVVFLWASLVALVVGLWPIDRFASLLIAPYLLWVSFAAWLNWAIVRLNRPFGLAAQRYPA
ncbi:TspO/MBR family protein [Sphingomonas sp. CFBP 13733]|uniref:TspO/MBR family protein n=1 Tax=Sphingomonas sp. CFBP 13733 TaxID=2775291 RepID=UPI0017832E27|nr:TspO/MBR family protein [Sphingomonas sp. CFBP 13733]MBD8641050.1 tryptophan-rich sensory protein [Sphingomonas sp. CFBP 13733]